MDEENKIACADCGELFDEDTMTRLASGDYVCETCLENYARCERCESYYPQDEVSLVHARSDKYWCDSCRCDYAIQCDACREWYQEDSICTDEGGVSYCNDCSDSYIICESCGNWTDDWDEDNRCPDCSTDSDLIHDYSSKPYPIFHPSEADLYFGVELETDDYSERQDAAQALYNLSDDEQLFYMKEDSSLNNGIEIVTHPCSLEYHQFEFPWQKIVETVRKHDGISHNQGRCGLHVHFNRGYFGDSGSREEELALLKFMFMFEKYWDNLVKFSRRTESQLQSWARKYQEYDTNSQCSKDPEFNPTDPTNGIDKIKKAKSGAGHGCATNLSGNDGSTIEIRLFRGTLNLESLLACIELTDFLARTAKTKSANALYRMNWKQLVKSIRQTKYPNLIAYLRRRELCV